MRRQKAATFPYTLPILCGMKPAPVHITALAILASFSVIQAQAPTPTVVESPNVKVLTGLYAQPFQDEMNFMVQALGVSCNTCHVRGNFASEDNAKKIVARRMLEMTRAINTQFFPDHKPQEGESVLGKVTCYTCHKGETTPKHTVGF